MCNKQPLDLKIEKKALYTFIYFFKIRASQKSKIINTIFGDKIVKVLIEAGQRYRLVQQACLITSTLVKY